MKKERNEVTTMIQFDGVAKDGGFVFYATVSSLMKGLTTMMSFKVIAYEDGVMEIAMDYKETIPRVAELVAAMFSKKSSFRNLETIILNYRNINLKIGKNTGRKNVICMLQKAMSTPYYKKRNNEVSVDIQTCQKRIPLRKSDIHNIKKINNNNFFVFDVICGWRKSLWFINPYTKENIIIQSIKDGTITIEGITYNNIKEFVANLKKIFVPYSNFYGVKAVELNFNEFCIRVDEHNIDRILYLYKKSCDMSECLWRREVFETFIPLQS